jgi:hypothetical protein
MGLREQRKNPEQLNRAISILDALGPQIRSTENPSGKLSKTMAEKIAYRAAGLSTPSKNEKKNPLEHPAYLALLKERKDLGTPIEKTQSGQELKSSRTNRAVGTGNARVVYSHGRRKL